jgi:hypothetical protein
MDTPAHGCGNSTDTGGLERFASFAEFCEGQSLLISRIELETKRCQHVTPPFLSGSVIRHKLFGMVAPEIFQRPGARFFQWRW